MLQNIWMLTKEEPNADSSYQYYYPTEYGIPQVAASYRQVHLQDQRPPIQGWLIICDDVTKALDYRKEGYAVLYQTEALNEAPVELPFVTDYPCDLSDEDLLLCHHRQHGLPITIATSEHFVIREITLEDLPALYELYDDDLVRRFVEPLYEYEEEARFQLDYMKHVYGHYGYGLWVVLDKSNGRLAARAGISVRESDGRLRDELGYVFHRDYRGKGYAYEVCRTILETAPRFHITELTIVTQPENEKALNLARRLGFQEETQAMVDGKLHTLLARKIPCW